MLARATGTPVREGLRPLAGLRPRAYRAGSAGTKAAQETAA
jgi:hypothetical protein